MLIYFAQSRRPILKGSFHCVPAVVSGRDQMAKNAATPSSQGTREPQGHRSAVNGDCHGEDQSVFDSPIATQSRCFSRIDGVSSRFVPPLVAE